MIKRIATYLGIFGIIIIAITLIAWATSPDPKLNHASFEDSPLVESIAPLDEAVTLAQYMGNDGKIATMQVLALDGEMVTGIDLTELGASANDDPFQALASASDLPLDAQTAQSLPKIEVDLTDLLPSGTTGGQHIGSGTNFPEHAKEAGSASVFNFPKFGHATPARTEVRANPGILLDYEVEFCIRFDRDITSVADFDAAMKGLFLCGDFTDRNALVHLADPDNLDSGYGFSDSKSGPDFFPTGPFLVIPNDWAAFVAELRMTTSVNNEPRQDARGREMTLNFRQLVEKSLGDMSKERFLYKDKFYSLAPDKRIDTSTTLMSGTSEGVIFTPPSRGDIIEGTVQYALAGGPLSGKSALDSVRQIFIENELKSGHFLKPGDIVRHRSSYLGNIEINVIE